MFYGYRTRFKTKFKLELYAVDKDDNDVLLRRWFGLNFENPKSDDSGSMTFNLSSPIKIMQFYTAKGILQTAGTTAELVTRLVDREVGGVSIFSKYFEGFSINPDAVSCMTISSPTINDKDTVLDKLRDYSFYQDFFYYVDEDGYFVWTNRDATASTIWELNGAGQVDSTYGTNIRSIPAAYDDTDNTYTRVVIGYKENGALTEKSFSGVRASDDSASLSDANSLTIFNYLKTNLWIDATTYKVAHLWVTDRSTLEAYFTSTWALYADGLTEIMDRNVKSEDGTYTKEVSWSVGDGSDVDIFGEKTFEQTYEELTATEATTIGDRLYNDYHVTTRAYEIGVFGLFHLMPKDKLLVNYLGEISVGNPFVLGVSTLGGGDVLAGRTGSIRIKNETVRLESISVNLDNFDIMLKVRSV
jgi:hypothetical protein